MFRALLVSLLVLGLLPAVAPAAIVDDVAVGETDDDDVAVWGKTVAWRDGERVVLRRPDGTTRTFPSDDDSSGLTIGPDAAGKLVLVYPADCRDYDCRLRRVDVATGRARYIAGIGRDGHSDPVLRRGVLVWSGPRGEVLSRKLAGGPIRREDLGRGKLEVTGLDHDGRRFAVTGQAADDPESETSYTEVRVGRLGARRTKRIGGLGSSQEYQAIRRPLLNATSVDVFKDDTRTFQAGDAYLRLLRYPLGSGRRAQRNFGVPFVAMDRGGGGTAIVQAPGTNGCAVQLEAEDDLGEGPTARGVPCRVVLAGGPPFGADTRRTVPELALGRDATHATGTVSRRLISPRTGGTTRSIGVAGVGIGVGAAPGYGKAFPGPAVRGVTDATGAFSITLAPALAKAPGLVAMTTVAPRAYAPEAATSE